MLGAYNTQWRVTCSLYLREGEGPNPWRAYEIFSLQYYHIVIMGHKIEMNDLYFVGLR